jgi:hypothetical protein
MCSFIPKSNLLRPLHQNRLAVLSKPSQDLLPSQLRQQLLDTIVKRDQATLDDLQRSNRSQQLRLRSQQKHSIVFDIGCTVLDRRLASSIAVLESACSIVRAQVSKVES